MKSLLKLLGVGALGIFVWGALPTRGQADERDYWQNHWSWFDNTYSSYYTRSNSTTPIGGGAYTVPRDPDSQRLRREGRDVTPIGGGAYRVPRDPETRRLRRDAPYSTPIGGGSYHAPRSFYKGAPGYRRPGSYARPTDYSSARISYGWW